MDKTAWLRAGNLLLICSRYEYVILWCMTLPLGMSLFLKISKMKVFCCQNLSEMFLMVACHHRESWVLYVGGLIGWHTPIHMLGKIAWLCVDCILLVVDRNINAFILFKFRLVFTSVMLSKYFLICLISLILGFSFLSI